MNMLSRMATLMLPALCVPIVLSKTVFAESVCGKATSQTAISQCVTQEKETADAALTHVYRSLTAKLSEPERLKLRAAERAWIEYRDRMCMFAGVSREGGSMQGMVITMCQTEMIQEQTRKLQWQLSCREIGEDCSHF